MRVELGCEYNTDVKDKGICIFCIKPDRNILFLSPILSLLLLSVLFLAVIATFLQALNIFVCAHMCVCLYQVEIMRLISETSFWVIHCSDYYVLLAETHCPVALMHFHRLITHQSKALKILRHVECAILHFLYQKTSSYS